MSEFVVCPTPASEIKGRDGEKPGDKIVLYGPGAPGATVIEVRSVLVSETLNEPTDVRICFNGGRPTFAPDELVLRVVDPPARREITVEMIEAVLRETNSDYDTLPEMGKHMARREAEPYVQTALRVLAGWSGEDS